MSAETETGLEQLDQYKWGFSKPENYVFKSRKGLSHEIVEEISVMKDEPQWMRDFRHKSLDYFLKRPMPTWGGDLSEIDFDDIYYYIKPTQQAGTTWEELPTEIKDTFEQLGIPEAERKYLAGVGAQYECLTGDTRVYTARGLVPIREIEPGDTVFSFDEEANRIIPAKVRATAEKGEREVFEVRVGTRRIKATANHPFLTVRDERPNSPQWTYLSDLSVGDLVATATTLHAEALVGAATTYAHHSSNVQTLERPEETYTTEFHGYAKIEAITPAGVAMVYDIEVEGPHNFVAEGLIVHNSEVIYHKVREDLEKLGVIFVDPGTGLREHEELFRKYFATVIPPNDNKFAALNSAVWSGGSFIYIPKGVKVEIPLQAYFRINAQNMGQFERTLIIADEDSYVHYVEGCFLAGARVRTRDGEKLIEEIREGDEVLTHKGRYRRVYHTMQRPYKGDIYRVCFFGDSWRELHITEEHPLLVARRKKSEYRNETFKPEWLPISEVKPGDYLMIPVPQPENQSETGHTITIPLGHGRHEPVLRDVTFPLEPDFFRLLGYYHAEGHVDNEHYISFSFHVEETDLLNDAHDLIERYLGKAPIENKPRQNGQTLVLASTEMARAFARTLGSTVYNKHVPEFIRNAPTECLAQWVRGAWLGDGSYDTRKNMFRFSSVSQELAYAFRDALLRLGVAASVNLNQRGAPRQPLYHVVISSPWNERFGEIVGYDAPGGVKEGSPFALDEQYLYVPIRAIEIEPMEATVYNFSVEEDESYVAEGVISHNCTAPTYTTDSLHSAVVEIIVHKNARVRYTTIQNWSKNVYNLVTKRAVAYEGATMEWVDGNLGSKLTMKYPAVWLMEPHARGEVLSVAFASDGQHQDAGGKVVHVAPNTSSQIVSKSISKGTGRSSYRGLLKVQKGARGVKSNVRCDALLLDETSRTDTYPYIEIEEEDVEVGHEATVSKVGEEQLFYLMSRGLSESEAYTMIVSGFIEPIAKELPLEYAVELNRLIQLEMSGSVG